MLQIEFQVQNYNRTLKKHHFDDKKNRKTERIGNKEFRLERHVSEYAFNIFMIVMYICIV